jgi:drug/metabolite transporter (DMT)-like permease
MRRWQGDAALVLVTAIWGSTFVVVKHALDAVGPLVFVAARFWVASAALLAVVALRRLPLRRSLLREGAITGVFLTVGYVTQTLGLQTTEAAKAAFITGLSVVLVPVLAALLLRQPPSRAAAVGVVLAAVGLGLLTLDRRLHLAPGDLWVLACAVGFAAHITATAHFAPHHEALAFTLVQMLTAAALTTMAALGFERDALILPAGALPAVLYMGVFASALVFFVQSWAQQRTTPTHTALIFALEPVFAALFAVLVAGEVLAPRAWVGGTLILLGMVVAEAVPGLRRGQLRSRRREDAVP